MSNFEDMIRQMQEFLKSEARTETVIGQQFTLGEYTCVPVISLGIGIGGGGGEGTDAKKNQGEGGGAGAGAGINPVGFLVTKGDQIQFIAATKHSGIGTAFEKLPDLLKQYLDHQKPSAN